MMMMNKKTFLFLTGTGTLLLLLLPAATTAEGAALLRGRELVSERCIAETRDLSESPEVAAARERVQEAVKNQCGQCPGIGGGGRGCGWEQWDAGDATNDEAEGGWANCTDGECDGGGGDQRHQRWGWGDCDVAVPGELLQEFASACQQAGGQFQVMNRFQVDCTQTKECCNDEDGWEGWEADCPFYNESETCDMQQRCRWNATAGCTMGEPCRFFGTNSTACEESGGGCTWSRKHARLGHRNLPTCMAQSCFPDGFAEQVQRQAEQVWKEDLEQDGDAVTCVASYEALSTGASMAAPLHLGPTLLVTFFAIWVVV
jgi:hypothetical protein